MRRDFASALFDFDEAIRLDPAFAAAYNNRGLAHIALRDFERGIADTDEAIRLEPSNPRYLNNGCWRRAIAGLDLENALASCNAALALGPDNASRRDSRALVLLRLGRFAEAWTDWDFAARADGVNAHYRYGRGIAALRMGRAAEGEADIAEARRLDAGIAATFERYGVRP